MRKKTTRKGRKAKPATASSPAAEAPPARAVSETPPAARATRKGPAKRRSARYTPEQQAEIVKFVKDHNEEHGRAGQASASGKALKFRKGGGVGGESLPRLFPTQS